jgi:hypothetical protein
MNNQTGIPHSRTLRNPGLYTASATTTAANIQNMIHLRGRHHSMPFGSTLQSCWMMRWPVPGCGNGWIGGNGICAIDADARSNKDAEISVFETDRMIDSSLVCAQNNTSRADCKFDNFQVPA